MKKPRPTPRSAPQQAAETAYRERKPGALVRLSPEQWDLVDRKRGSKSRPAYLAWLARLAIGWNDG